VIGALAVILIKPVFVVLTSFIGTYLLVMSIDTLAGGSFKDITMLALEDPSAIQPDWVNYVEFAILFLGTIGAALFQFLVSAKHYSHDGEKIKYSKIDQDLFN
jgi:hypothetical protein